MVTFDAIKLRGATRCPPRHTHLTRDAIEVGEVRSTRTGTLGVILWNDSRIYGRDLANSGDLRVRLAYV